MYIHIGGDYVIPESEIISIIDIDSTISKDTKNFMDMCKEEGFLINTVGDNIKSLVITEKKSNNSKARKSTVYCTNIKSNTIYKRSK